MADVCAQEEKTYGGGEGMRAASLMAMDIGNSSGAERAL